MGDAQRQPFGDRGLAHARLADQHRVVLGPARQDLDGAANFLVAADHGVELAGLGRLGQVAREFLQRIIAVFGARRIGGAAAAQLVDRAVQRLGAHAGGRQRLAGRRGRRQRQRQQQPFDGDEAVARLLRHLLGGIEHAHGIIVEARRLLRAAARYGRHPGQRGIGLAQRSRGIAARRLDQAGRHALLIFQQCLQQMFGADPLMVHADRNGLRRLEETLGAVGEFFEVH